MAEHTPEPWEWSGRRLFRDNRSEGQLSSSTILLVESPIWLPNEADARLIAASPKLLETLSDLIAVVETYDDAWNPEKDLYVVRHLASEAEREARGEGSE